MEKSYISGISIRATLKEMSIGDIIHFPVARLSVVRSTASTLSLELERKYKSRLNRLDKTVDVTRIE